MFKLVNVLLVSSAMLFGSNLFGQSLDSESATVSLAVGKYAKISMLNDFALSTSGTDGDANAIYDGGDEFRVESNCPVLVSVAGGDLSNGSDSIQTIYQLDSQESFQTAGKHDGMHQVSAQATLGNISDQEAGGYAANITITVSAL